VVKLSQGWLPVGVRESRCSTTTDICPQSSQSETTPYLYLCQSRTTWRDQYITQLQRHLIYTSTAVDPQCIIAQGIQKLLTINVKTFAIKFTHGWLPAGVWERRCSATTDTCPHFTQSETVPHMCICQSCTYWRDQFITQLQKHLIDTSTAADLRCIIVQGIQNWFLTGDKNEPDSTDPNIQIGWFQVLKGLPSTPVEYTTSAFFRTQGLGDRRTRKLISLFGRKAIPCGKIGVHPHTPLATTTPTSLALVLDRQHNNAWKWHTHTVLICWLTIGVFSISHWRNDYNNEPLIWLIGPRQCFPLSIKASVMLRLSYIPVNKKSVPLSPS
jgi:hypothetical protein